MVSIINDLFDFSQEEKHVTAKRRGRPKITKPVKRLFLETETAGGDGAHNSTASAPQQYGPAGITAKRRGRPVKSVKRLFLETETAGGDGAHNSTCLAPQQYGPAGDIGETAAAAAAASTATVTQQTATGATGAENNMKPNKASPNKTILYTIYLTPYLKVTLLTYDNDLYMDVRKDDKHICLNVNQIWELEMVMHRVTEALEETKKGIDPRGRFALQNQVWVTVSPDIIGVDIRRYFSPENSSVLQPTRKGVFFTPDVWEKFCNILVATGVLYPPFFGYAPSNMLNSFIL